MVVLRTPFISSGCICIYDIGYYVCREAHFYTNSMVNAKLIMRSICCRKFACIRPFVYLYHKTGEDECESGKCSPQCSLLLLFFNDGSFVLVLLLCHSPYLVSTSDGNEFIFGLLIMCALSLQLTFSAVAEFLTV